MLRFLGATYWRFVGSPPATVYELLEPMYTNYQRIVVRNLDGTFRISHVDEYVDDLISQRTILGMQRVYFEKNKAGGFLQAPNFNVSFSTIIKSVIVPFL